MKISSSLDHGMQIGGVTPLESARMMREAGFDGVDLNMSTHSTEPDVIQSDDWKNFILEQASALKQYGLEIAQCHLPSYPGHIDNPGDGSYQAFEDFMLPSILRALEICGEIRCPVAVLHPYFEASSAEQTLEGNLKMIQKMIPVLEKNNIRLALENVYAYRNRIYNGVHVGRAQDLIRIVDGCGNGNVGICLDTGHANLLGENIPDFAAACGSRLFALHVNGNCSKHDEHVVPYSMSSWCEGIDYRKLASVLHDIGFNGYYNLELSTGPMPSVMAKPFYNYVAAMARALADL